MLQHRRCPKGYSIKQGKLSCSIYKGKKMFAIAPNRRESVAIAWVDFEYHKRCPTKRALDGAKAPRKSKRSTGSPRK